MTMEQAPQLKRARRLLKTLDPGSSGLRITETARRLGVTTRALRYYEDEHLVTPGRTAKGNRVYCAATRERLQLIVTFRRLNVPVATIRNAFNTDSADLVRTLRRRMIALEAEQRLLHETIAAVARDGNETHAWTDGASEPRQRDSNGADQGTPDFINSETGSPRTGDSS